MFKYLYDEPKIKVDLYCIINNRFLSSPGFDLSENNIKVITDFQKLGNEIIPLQIKAYLGKSISNTNLYIHKVSLRYLFGLHNLISKNICSKEYDVIHLIGFSSIYIPILKHCKSKFVLSLHESNPFRISINKMWLLSVIKKHLLKKQFEIVHKVNHITFFSSNEDEKFISLYPEFISKTSVVKFGLFESFNYFVNTPRTSPITGDSDYILFLGLIREYKGINFLINSIRESEFLSNQKFVIAGKDELGIDVEGLKNVSLINKYLNDSEMVDLIINSKLMILPYLSASQSGLPCIALQFGKPFIFSDVKGLNEYLTDGYNGYIFNTGNSESLENAIKKIMENRNYAQLQNNIKRSSFYDNLNWNEVVKKFVRVYSNLATDDL